MKFNGKFNVKLFLTKRYLITPAFVLFIAVIQVTPRPIFQGRSVLNPPARNVQ